MSAITGLFNLDGEAVGSEDCARLMSGFEKFPSDDRRTWKMGPVFLGCHAQWMTPESVGEVLPFYDSSRRLAITADAIIDNRDELFNRLQIENSKRKNMSDSELILLSYDKWGESCLKYLLGDYAFMIWDEKRHRLFGARDPSGYRTLYYYRDKRRFVFSTTIEPIASLPFYRKVLNEHWLAEFLAIPGMIDSLDARMTPYLKIEQVPPFHSISVTEDKLQIEQYGSFYTEPLKLKSHGDYVEAFQDVFQKAVQSRLRSTRNIGSQLSGGLDSGSVVGFAARELQQKQKKLHTFSYIPPSDFVELKHEQLLANESPLIKKTADFVGGLETHFLNFEGKNSYLEMDELLRQMEMPYKFIENSFWLKGMFEQAAKQDVGILLNGDKGNFTISWGNALDYYAVLFKNFKWVKLNQELTQWTNNMGGSKKRWFKFVLKESFPLIDQLRSKKTVSPNNRLIHPEFAAKTNVFGKLASFGYDQSGDMATGNLYEQKRMLFKVISPWNSGNTMDCKLSLQHRLWKRDPTNDLRVVQFCLSLPEEQFVQNGLDRALIRNSTNGILPDDIRLNQRVRGIQGADWIHRMKPVWASFLEESSRLTKDDRLLEYIDGQVLSSAYEFASKGPSVERFLNQNYRILMKSMMVSRYLNRNFT